MLGAAGSKVQKLKGLHQACFGPNTTFAGERHASNSDKSSF